MRIEDLKKACISELILIILNNKLNDSLRKYAEIELKQRIRNIGWNYDDLLHFDDNAIKLRGLSVFDYLISPNVNMQQLMETYFKYEVLENNGEPFTELLFSEKHLCNSVSFRDLFFKKICNLEIKNIDRRIKGSNDPSEKGVLRYVQYHLRERQAREKNGIDELVYNNYYDALLTTNEALAQLNEDEILCFLNNISDEEEYRLLKSKFGRFKLDITGKMNSSFLIDDVAQDLYGLRFVLKDSAKLKRQKRILMEQVKNGYEVDYQNEVMTKALKLTKGE